MRAVQNLLPTLLHRSSPWSFGLVNLLFLDLIKKMQKLQQNPHVCIWTNNLFSCISLVLVPYYWPFIRQEKTDSFATFLDKTLRTVIQQWLMLKKKSSQSYILKCLGTCSSCNLNYTVCTWILNLLPLLPHTDYLTSHHYTSQKRNYATSLGPRSYIQHGDKETKTPTYL